MCVRVSDDEEEENEYKEKEEEEEEGEDEEVEAWNIIGKKRWSMRNHHRA